MLFRVEEIGLRRPIWLGRGIMTVLMVAAAGCTGMRSTPLSSGDDNYTGQVYFLPTTRILLSVIVRDDQIIITADQPEYLADEKHPYRLSLVPSIVHAQTSSVTVGSNNLLTKVALKAESTLGEVATAAGKWIGSAAESLVTSDGGELIYDTRIDAEALADTEKTNELKTLNDNINNALKQKLAEIKKRKMLGDSKPFLEGAATASKPVVTVKVTRVFPKAKAADTTPEDCTVGFCYRKPVSYFFDVTFYDGTSHQTLFAVPNGSPTYAAAVSRGLFVTWDTTAVLTNGMLTGYDVTTVGGELPEALLIPFNFVGGAISGITQKGKLLDSRSSMIKSGIALREEERKAADARTEAESSFANTGSLFKFIGGSPLPPRNVVAHPVVAPAGLKTPGNLGTGKP
jgi:hypothetical protein